MERKTAFVLYRSGNRTELNGLLNVTFNGKWAFFEWPGEVTAIPSSMVQSITVHDYDATTPHAMDEYPRAMDERK